MLGAIAGDIIGSVFEWNNIKTIDFPLFTLRSRFTDDTVLTIAVADAILNKQDYARTIWDYGRRYPHAGYGGSFAQWLQKEDLLPYNSFGNGSAMRVSAVGFAFNSINEVLAEAAKSAEVTHNHPEGIKGAQAVALSILLARQSQNKAQIKQEVESRFGYNLDRTLNEIRPAYSFDVSCQGSVPEAIIAFLESNDFEDAIRKAVSLGGDSDTIACIAGAIAQAYYKQIPENIVQQTRKLLTAELLQVIDAFSKKYGLY